MNETTMNETIAELVDAIVAHQNKHGIVSMFKKGPPIGKGFMWCDENDNTYWTEEESNGLAVVRDMVLNKGWESSGYAIMMRNLQNEINKIT